MRVTFVCTGNTCRSPMLAFMFGRYAAENGIEATVSSAGIKGGGSPVNPLAVAALARRGIGGDEVAAFRSAVFDEETARLSDAVFTMTEEQKEFLLSRFPSAKAECLSCVAGKEIEDPYGKGEEAYEETAKIFDALLGKLGDRLRAYRVGDGVQRCKTQD